MLDYRYYIEEKDFIKAEENGIDRVNVQNRVYGNGWAVDKAITTPLRKRKNGESIYTKEVLRNLEKYGLSKEVFYARRRKGWTIKEASTTPLLTAKEIGARRKAKLGIEGYKGGLTQYHFDKALEIGLSKQTVYNRVNSLNWSIERAISEPLNLQKCGYYTKLRNKQKALKG